MSRPSPTPAEREPDRRSLLSRRRTVWQRLARRLLPGWFLATWGREVSDLLEAERIAARRCGRAALIAFHARTLIDLLRTARETRRGLAGRLGWDVRLALRRLRRDPGFSLAAVLTLALGIGAMSAVLTVVYGVLLAPLPYPDANRLVVIEHELPGFETPDGRPPTIGGQYAQLAYYLERSRSFDDIGGFATFDAALVGAGDAQFLRMASATAGFFRALGLPPHLGRLLVDDDPAPDANVQGPALLGHDLWSQRFGRDTAAVGRALRAQGFSNAVIGVLPSELSFPPDRVSLWVSLPLSRVREKPDWMLTRLVGRLAPGVTPEQARDELNRLLPDLPDRFPTPIVRRAVVDGALRARVVPLRTWLAGDVERPLWLLLAAVWLVLAIACVNVVNLMLVRTEARRQELALLGALGATRWRLAGLFAAESLALVTTAAVAGAALAAVAVRALLRTAPAWLPSLEAIGAGWQLAVFSAAPALLCATVFACVPWLGVAIPARGATSLSHQTTAGRGQLRVRRLLVAGQLAMTFALLVAAGLIGRSFVALTRVDLGFSDRGVLTFRIPFPFQELQAAGPGGRVATPFYDELVERVAALPGVDAVGYATCVPLSDACGTGGFSLRREDRPHDGGPVPVIEGLRASPGYLQALGVPLLKGRPLERLDHEQRTNAVLISAEAARRLFGDEDPIGRRLVQDGRPEWTPFTVVGVVGDVRHHDPRRPHMPFLYAPMLGHFAATEPWAVSFVVRTADRPAGLVDTIRHEVARVRPDVPVAHAEMMETLVAGATAEIRLAVWVLGVAAVTTLLLGAIGVYGVMAYAVARRRSEFGIRLALGADGRQLRAMVLRQGAATTAVGLLAGLTAALLVGRLLQSFLFEVGPADLPTFAGTACGLALMALAAVYVPARRVSRLDPVDVLKTL